MSKMDQNKTKPVKQNVTPQTDAAVDTDRREALQTMGKCAAYVAPAMLVLLNGSKASAHHKPGHSGGPGSNGPNCNNPGLHLGFNQNGHSGC